MVVPCVYKVARAKRRLSEHLAAVSDAEAKELHCDERALRLLNDQLGLLLSSGRGFSGLEDIYLQNKEGDAPLEMIQLFARAFIELPAEDKWIVEQVLRRATEDRRAAYLMETLGQAASGR